MATPGNENETRVGGRTWLLLQVLTLSRIVLAVILAAILFFAELSSGILFLGLILIASIELTDVLDGRLARRWGLVTEFGAALDPYADSVTRLIVYWGLASAGMVLYLVMLVMALRDVTVAYCRITLTRHGKSVSALWSGKIKAMIQGAGAMAAVLGPLYWSRTGTWTINLISWVVIGATAASVIEYAAAAYSATRQTRKERREGSE
jgi:CDP-diacylglycerol--glycerol-3-phosphate 3-phosphatidyltransferase